VSSLPLNIVSLIAEVDAACLASQRCICKFTSSAGGIMLSFKLSMIHSDPMTTRITMSRPNASASTSLVLFGPVVMCRKKHQVNSHLGAPRARHQLGTQPSLPLPSRPVCCR
jgi:hypothetical protein